LSGSVGSISVEGSSREPSSAFFFLLSAMVYCI
jgi:hypothetical protein